MVWSLYQLQYAIPLLFSYFKPSSLFSEFFLINSSEQMSNNANKIQSLMKFSSLFLNLWRFRKPFSSSPQAKNINNEALEKHLLSVPQVESTKNVLETK